MISFVVLVSCSVLFSSLGKNTKLFYVEDHTVWLLISTVNETTGYLCSRLELSLKQTREFLVSISKEQDIRVKIYNH